MNYKFRHTALLAALPLLLAACQTDDEPMPQTGRQANTLRFTVDAAIALTKSLPENPQTQAGAVQHVNAARLYIFKHGEGDQTTLAACEEIDDFNSLDTTDGGGKEVTGFDGLTTVTKEYKLQTTLEAQTTYTFLGVGYEKQDETTNKYGDAYQEMYNNTALAVSESPVLLSSLVTTLKDGRGKEDIRHNEYFTGALTLTTDSKGYIKSGSTVEMRRRVAGLSAHLRLKNFPDDEAIGGVAIMLWDEQNQSVPTLEKTWQLPDFTDFTDKPLETPDATKPQDQSVCLLWMTKPETDTQAYSEATSDYTCQGSAYVLPKPAPEAGSTDYTLAVVVYNAENKVICTKRAALAEDSHLIFDTSLGTGIIDDGSFYRYPIVANRFYRFGDDKPLDVVYDPQNPFEILIDPNWEGKPNMGVDDYNPDTDNQ